MKQPARFLRDRSVDDAIDNGLHGDERRHLPRTANDWSDVVLANDLDGSRVLRGARRTIDDRFAAHGLTPFPPHAVQVTNRPLHVWSSPAPSQFGQAFGESASTTTSSPRGSTTSGEGAPRLMSFSRRPGTIMSMTRPTASPP